MLEIVILKLSESIFRTLNKVDSSISFCKWAHGINKKTGQPKTNPRHMKWLDKKFGMNEGKNSQ